jgi:hypothetical protein
MLPREYYSIVKGYNRKQYISSVERRYQTFITVLPHVKNVTYDKFCREFWPLSDDKFDRESEIIEPVKVDTETWAALKKQMSPKVRKSESPKSEYERILSKHNL